MMTENRAKRPHVDVYFIVMLRVFARIEAKLTDKPYQEIIEGYKQEIEDLRLFFMEIQTMRFNYLIN